MSKVWIETAEITGALMNADDAKISVFDHGFTVGDGVFETVKTVDGVPFALEQHLTRLEHSARTLKMSPPNLESVSRAVNSVCSQTEVSHGVGRLRITWTSGVGVLGSERGKSWTLVVAWAPATAWPATAKLEISNVKRNQHSPLSGAKTTSYAENALAIAEAKAAGADEALLLNLDEKICEGASSNIFIVKDSHIMTPPASDGCLVGVTRNLVLDVARQHFDVMERSISLQELFGADEVFITSSTRDIQPVAAVGNQEYSGRRPVTTELMRLFAQSAEENFNV